MRAGGSLSIAQLVGISLGKLVQLANRSLVMRKSSNAESNVPVMLRGIRNTESKAQLLHQTFSLPLLLDGTKKGVCSGSLQ